MDTITETKTMSPVTDLAPATPDWMAPLSRELESVIAKRNLLTCRTRRKVLDDLHEAAAKEEVTRAHCLHMLYQYKLNNSSGCGQKMPYYNANNQYFPISGRTS